jgi:hypothetical protein
MHPRHLSCTFNRYRPSNSPLNELFHLRSQLGLYQSEVINGASAQDCHPREASAAAVHKSPARLAKVVRHARVGSDCFGLAEGGEVTFTAGVLEMRVCNGDVGLVERRSDLAAVDAMADMTVYEAWFLQWLYKVLARKTQDHNPREDKTKEQECRSLRRINADQLTSTSCTDPQKQVAVASFSVDQPSSERLTIG